MPGLVPGIHEFVQWQESVDGRDKPGHDEYECGALERLLLHAELLDLVDDAGLERDRLLDLAAAVRRLALAALHQTDADQRRRVVLMDLERGGEILQRLVEIVLENVDPPTIDIAVCFVRLELDDLGV